MRNEKILEMIDNGRLEELKAALLDEIYIRELKSKPGAKQRYAAMKKYFSYRPSGGNKVYGRPCVVDFEGEKYTSFVNGYSLALTKEPGGEMELFENPGEYINVGKIVAYEGEEKPIDFSSILAGAKSKGYRLKRSEVEPGGNFKYVFRYDGAYFKIGLLDATYGIINNGETAAVYHKSGCGHSPMIIRNSIGVCVILPFNYTENEEMALKNGRVVIGIN